MKEYILGKGNVEITPVIRDGVQHGILIKQLSESHPVGDMIENAGQEVEDSDDVIIWFDNEAGARVLQDQVHMSIMNLLGIKIARLNELHDYKD